MSKQRPYPRFLFSNPQNTLEKGPYITHAKEPRFIAKVLMNDFDGKNIPELEILEVWNFAFTPQHKAVQDSFEAMKKWFKAQLILREIKLY